MNNHHCSPSHVTNVEKTNSCMSHIELTRIFNKYGVHNDKQQLWKNGYNASHMIDLLNSIFNTKKGEEYKWIEHIDDSETLQIISNAYMPMKPYTWYLNPTEWLDSVNITDVLRRYEMCERGIATKFKFIGTYPRDFANDSRHNYEVGTYETKYCLCPHMCELHYDNINTIGIVFNNDNHHNSGSHWTACYISTEKTNKERYGIWYYDSYGKMPVDDINKFLLYLQSTSSDPDFKVHYNNVRKQYESSECGIYSIVFIIYCLTTDYSFDEICSSRMLPDAEMFKYRDVLFI